jgi:hypothetical protein
MTPLDAAITWIQKGFSPVPVPHRSKRPVLKEWQRFEITTEGASQYFNGASQNIGVLLGDKFGSADVDCDCPEAITAARELLPETGLIFGRQFKPFSHFFYRSDPPARTMQLIDPLDQSTIVELRGLKLDGSIGLQTVVPPSIHKSGEPAPRVRLNAPGEAPEQELLVIGSRFLTEHLAVSVLELANGQMAQALDLFLDLG